MSDSFDRFKTTPFVFVSTVQQFHIGSHNITQFPLCQKDIIVSKVSFTLNYNVNVESYSIFNPSFPSLKLDSMMTDNKNH